jgi:hypothetical protein
MSAIGPGDMVECIDAGPSGSNGHGSAWEPGAAPVMGAIYTVVEVFIDVAGREALELSEIRRGPEAIRVWGGRVGYGPRRFRPIRKPKSDFIEALKQPAPAGVRELEDA